MIWPFNKKDKASGTLTQAWQSCTGEDNVLPEPVFPPEWAPHELGIKIVVAGDLSDSREVGRAVMRLQEELRTKFARDFSSTKPKFCVETFLDGCRHSTGWSDNHGDILSRTTRWHCFQTSTHFNEAFREMRQSAAQDAHIVIMVGNRFDDNLADTVKAARALFTERKTRVYALPMATASQTVAESYKQIAQSGGGLSIPLLDFNARERDYAQIVGELATHALYATAGASEKYRALPAPAEDAARRTRQHLLDAPKNKL